MLDLFKFSVKRVFLLSLFFLFIFSNFVSAVPPFNDQTNFVSSTGLRIEFPSYVYGVSNTAFMFPFHVYNISNGLALNSSIFCVLHVYDMVGSHLLILNQSSVEHGYDYEFDIPSTTFQDVGVYRFLVYCEHSSGIGGFVAHGFEITSDGFISSFDSLFKYVLLIIVAFVLFGFGMFYKSYTPTILGGFMLFLIGLWILIQPIGGLLSWINYVLGACLFGFGAYIWIVVSIEESDI